MAKNKKNSKKIKKTTNDIIDKAISRQNSWMRNRSRFAKRFFRSLNVFAKSSEKEANSLPAKSKSLSAKNKKTVALKAKQAVKKSGKQTRLAAYWFPILCAVAVILIAVWVAFISNTSTNVTTKIIVVPSIPEPIIKIIEEDALPEFDIVRIEPTGSIIVVGRWLEYQNVSIIINNKIVATERTNSNGEFVYSPTRALKPGNYTIQLLGVDKDIKSQDKVFVYVSEHGAKNSISLLMTKKGSTLLQSPQLVDGDLTVSKIDYLSTGRIVITGNALPRLRVSLTLNNDYLGFARVSDHKHYGLGADIEKLTPGKEYKLAIRLHDGDGKIVSEIEHKFIMPESTGNDDTFYTVRRGDSLWIIAKNFMGRGILFSVIVDANKSIKNPDLIYPKQKFRIPVESK